MIKYWEMTDREIENYLTELKVMADWTPKDDKWALEVADLMSEVFSFTELEDGSVVCDDIDEIIKALEYEITDVELYIAGE